MEENPLCSPGKSKKLRQGFPLPTSRDTRKGEVFLMKRIFCVIVTALFLLPLALSAQEFDPARGPLEGVWENESDDEDVIIFTGNLALGKNSDATYSVYPGMEYENSKVRSPTEPDYTFSYKLSGNILTLTDEYDYTTNYKRSSDAILQNKGPLEGVWTAVYSDSDITGVMTWICIGRLLIMLMESDSFSGYSDGYEFTYSDTDHTMTAMNDTISCVLSGDTMTMGDDEESFVFTRRK
jgi:hypothetical protein